MCHWLIVLNAESIGDSGAVTNLRLLQSVMVTVINVHYVCQGTLVGHLLGLSAWPVR